MLKRSITYTDFDGVERTEDFYFNITKSELVKMESSEEGGMYNKLDRLMKSPNGREIMEIMNEFLTMAYGEKSPDGRRFVKSKEISDAFMQTPAYDQIFMELVTDSQKAADFINRILPDLSDMEAAKASAPSGITVL